MMRQVRLVMGLAAVILNFVIALVYPEGTWQGMVRSIALSGIGAFLVQEVCYEYRRDRRDHRGARPDPRSRLHAGFAIDPDSGLAVRADAIIPESAGPRVELEPIRAWKVATISGNRFVPLNGSFGTYGIEEVARCAMGKNHAAPNGGCSCGFYARPTREECGPLESDQVLLEVELYGRIVVGKNGYRAEKQRVLAVWASRSYGPKCSRYIGENGVTITPHQLSHYLYGYTMPCNSPGHFVVAGETVPVCAKHALEVGKRMTEYTPMIPDLSVEWRWID